jgi:cell wall-associated NlpC family hydrolase
MRQVANKVMQISCGLVVLTNLIIMNPMTKLVPVSYLLCITLALASASCVAAPKSPAINLQDTSSVQTQTNQVDDPTWSEQAREVLLNAISLTGIRYKYGGDSPETGFDCSGFVRYVYQQAANLSLPHGARAISQLGKTIPKHELKPGDLVFFNTLKSAFSHVGIYVGNNRFIHSPSSGGGVRVEDMETTYWEKRFNGAQRIEK